MTARLGARKRRIRVQILRVRDGDRCTWCCRTLKFEPIFPEMDCSDHATLEHLVPVSRGGSDDTLNLALACFACNNLRGNELIEFVPPWGIFDGIEMVTM